LQQQQLPLFALARSRIFRTNNEQKPLQFDPRCIPTRSKRLIANGVQQLHPESVMGHSTAQASLQFKRRALSQRSHSDFFEIFVMQQLGHITSALFLHYALHIALVPMLHSSRTGIHFLYAFIVLYNACSRFIIRRGHVGDALTY
jgi:hypothetical protein